jgi:hypothetical protein
LSTAVAIGTFICSAAAATAVVPSADQSTANGTTEFRLHATKAAHNAHITGGQQGFSVESADFAHGFLTKQLLGQPLRTLNHDGVLRIGGYSMDLVWPAFGKWSDTPAPEQAIGGTVDQSDLDALKQLLDDTGWKVTLGLPLKTVIDPSKIKNPSKDPSPDVSLDQVVAEVAAAHETLGDDLLAVEVGNEYDNVTTLTPAEMWQTMKRYRDAIAEAIPDADLKVTGPSANTSSTNTKLEDFLTAAVSDTSTDVDDVVTELASHWYPGSHCGHSNETIAQLMSATTHTRTQSKLDGIMALENRLTKPVPMVINESNSASCSGQPGVSDSYATALWSLDYLMQASQTGIRRVGFHTNTAAVCGDFQERSSDDYPISYRYYGAFCADDQAALQRSELSAAPLYYGLWAFDQVPAGRFLDLDLDDSALARLRAYAVDGPAGTLTLVLINVQDPASTTSTTDTVTVDLPSTYQTASRITLRSVAPQGLASTDASAISLGGSRVAPGGDTTGEPTPTPVAMTGKSVTVPLAPGTASIVTLDHE